MKKIALFGMFLLSVMSVVAQNVSGGQFMVRELDVARNEDKLFVSMKLDLKELKLPSNHELVLTPMLVGVDDSMPMNPVILAGRNRFYYYLRNEKELNSRILCRAGEEELFTYQATVPFVKWMEESELVMHRDSCGCNELLMANEELLVALDFKPRVFVPEYVYLQPKVEDLKVRELKRQAYIDFPVSRTELYPDYRKNPIELKKIIATIDTVKNNPDTQITAIIIKGYASPESPYSNNKRLAEGRTKTLKEYVQKLYHFPEGVIATSYEPEDWEGLRKYVAGSDLEHKDGILALIDSSREPDNKEWTLKQTYPKEYAFLLKEVYPGLRHSDYVVEYIVRAYTDIEEAKRVFQPTPGNLSLHEMYLIAQTYLKGSEEYNEVFATMVRLFPDDEVANLNAANVAMSRNDLVSSEKYLEKAGKSGFAYYARGIHAGLAGDYETAKEFLNIAKEKGLAEADDALLQINEINLYIKNNQNEKF